LRQAGWLALGTPVSPRCASKLRPCPLESPAMDLENNDATNPRRAKRVTTERKPRKRLRSAIDNQRAAFLRRCRARIKPADVGLPQAQRTRTEGLRREDVAALSGVSASWYTWLEQGRTMRVSDEVL